MHDAPVHVSSLLKMPIVISFNLSASALQGSNVLDQGHDEKNGNAHDQKHKVSPGTTSLPSVERAEAWYRLAQHNVDVKGQ